MTDMEKALRWIEWLENETMVYLKGLEKEDTEIHDVLHIKFEKAILSVYKMIEEQKVGIK